MHALKFVKNKSNVEIILKEKHEAFEFANDSIKSDIEILNIIVEKDVTLLR